MAELKRTLTNYVIKISKDEAAKIQDSLEYLIANEIQNWSGCYESEKLDWQYLERFFHDLIND